MTDNCNIKLMLMAMMQEVVVLSREVSMQHFTPMHFHCLELHQMYVKHVCIRSHTDLCVL